VTLLVGQQEGHPAC